MEQNRKTIASLCSVLILIILASYMVQSNTDTITGYFGQGIPSMAIFALVMFLITIFAPVSGLPFFPIAVEIWGVWLTILLSLVGKMSGAMLAFTASRKYGTKIVQRFFSLEKIRKHQKRVPEQRVFLSLLLFRIAVPLDIFNYLFGLFSSISKKQFFAVTFLSLTFYIGAISYFGSLNWEIQAVIFVFGLAIGLAIWAFSRKRKNKHNTKK